MKKLLNIKIVSISGVGFLAGIISGLLGAGGGIIVVPSLMMLGLERKKSHAASICIMLPICIVSSIMYLKSGAVSVSQAMPYIPAGIAGAFAGSFVLSYIDQNILKKIFACLSIWAGFRLILR